ncbi:MAG: protease modulator HflC [Deltaproteobacteria bacterium]|nr:protease modulator HflC [Deltaproteobacteria bacterium]
MKTNISSILIIIILFVFLSSVYVVDETEQIIITQFGKAIGEPTTEPGIGFKIPVIQKINRFPKNLLAWDGDPDQVNTLDKTYLWVDTFARWKITDPLKYFETVHYEQEAQARLDGILNSSIRNAITSNYLIETVRNSNRELDISDQAEDATSMMGDVEIGRGQIAKGVIEEAQPKLDKFGIELVDLKIKRLNYVEEVRRSVYGRMIAERNQQAEKYRSEGRGEARKIEGEMEKEMKEITSEAYRTAEEIKGNADAQATLIYAQSFGRGPEFYSFLNTLDIYKDVMGKDSTLVLSTDSEFLKYFKGYDVE